MYGTDYNHTITLVGFDRSSIKVNVPKKILPQLVEWSSNVQYEVDGRILPQPKDWASLTGDGHGSEESVVGDNEDNELATMDDIESQVSRPFIMTSSPTRSNSFDNTPPLSTLSSPPTSNKKSRYA
jgi:hypothetical protein